MQNYLKQQCQLWERLLLLLAGFSLLYPGIKTDVFGAVLLLAVWGYQKYGLRNTAAVS
jgi:UPF0716 family protein affecting phage T7 exclusion